MGATDIAQRTQRLSGAILDAGLLQRLREELAVEIFDTLDELLGLDVEVVGDACSQLGLFTVFQVLSSVCPDLLAPPAEETFPAYSEEQLPAFVRRQVVRHLAEIMEASAHLLHGQASQQELMTLAKELVTAMLEEVAPSVLDQPVVYAHALARAINRVTARLLGLIQQPEFLGKHTHRTLAWGIFHDIVRETCPHYLQPV